MDWKDEKERSMGPSLKIESELKIDWDVLTRVLLGDGLLTQVLLIKSYFCAVHIQYNLNVMTYTLKYIL